MAKQRRVTAEELLLSRAVTSSARELTANVMRMTADPKFYRVRRKMALAFAAIADALLDSTYPEGRVK